MISAREALKLPTATLRPSDAQAAIDLLKEIETYVRANMDRGGCVIPIDSSRMNGAIAAEILRVCQSVGWIAEFQNKIEKSQLANVPVISGWQLSLQPTPESYRADDRVLYEALA